MLNSTKFATFVALLVIAQQGFASPAGDVLLNRIGVHPKAKLMPPQQTKAGRATEEWCDPILGCLYITDEWYTSGRPINVLPETRAKINTQFYLHTRATPNNNVDYPVYADDLTSLINSPFDVTKPTKLISHGFVDTGHTQWLNDLAIGLVSYGDYNVLRIDWGGGSMPMYYQATANTRVVGLEIGHLINTLIADIGLDPALVHCIGHSLGSHVCGYGGEQVPGMGRITGLDPAGPYFTGTPYFVHLDATDAVFVDAIHTDAESILLLGYGTGQPMGNLDFFPNSGHNQPGCNPAQISADMITEDMVDASRDLFACSHIRAIKYFGETLNSPTCLWVAHECYDYDSFEAGACYSCNTDNTKCAIMGIRADEYVAKTRVNIPFYIDTSNDEAFCMQHYQVSILTASPQEAESWVMGRLFIYLYGDTGEIIEDTQITKDHERIDHGQIKQNLFISRQDVGHVIRIELRWVYDDNVLNPGTYCWGLVCNRSLYVQSVKVSPISHYPESDRLTYSVTGCALDGMTTEIKDGDTMSFMPGTICTAVENP